MARRLRWWLGGALLALGIGLAIGEAAGWPFLRHPVQQALTRMTAVPVALEGRFRLRLLWRPTLEAAHVQVGAGGSVDVPYLLAARELDLGWRWRDLWQWHRGATLRVHRLHAQALTAYLVRGDDRRASWQLGGGGSSGAAPDVPRVGSLLVRDGHVVVDDAPKHTQLRIEVRGGEGEHPAQDAGYRMTVEGTYRVLPLMLKVQSGGALPLLRDSEADLPATDVPVLVEGRAGATSLRFEGRAGALLGEPRLHGELRLRGPSLASVAEPLGLTLPHTPPFDLEGLLGHAGGVWRLQADRMAIGSSLLNGDFRLDTREKPPLLQGRLGGQRLGLADLGPAVGVGAADATPGRAVRVLPQRRFNLPSLRAMNASLQVAVDELDLNSDALDPLLDLRTQLVLQDGILHLEDLNAHVAGGRFRGVTSLDANVEPARWTVDLRLGVVDIAGWLAGVRLPRQGGAPSRPDSAALKRQRQQARAGGEQQVQAYLTGALSGAVKATGRGRSVAEILGSLDGRAQLMVREGTMSHLVTEALGLDVAEALGVVVRGDRPLPLRCGWLDLSIHDGVVQPQLAVLDNDDTELRVTGRINLRDESLALRMEARPKDVSLFTLRTPVTLQGTLAAPVVGVEGGRLAAKAMGAAALGAAIGPLAALLPFIDLGVGDDNDACARKPPTPPPTSAVPVARSASR